MEIKYIVKQDQIAVRDFLTQHGYSRTFRKKVRLNDVVFVNGIPARNHTLLKCDDVVVIKTLEALNPEFLLNPTPLAVMFEDEYLLVIDKPAGVATQPSHKHPEDNIISMVATYYQTEQIAANIHILTRLDYQTTGLMVIAKSGIIHQMLSDHKITKHYLCDIKGHFDPPSGLIDLPIKRVVDYDIRRWVAPDGQRALTKYQTIEEGPLNSRLEVELLTGRTHQIRIHMAYLGHPLLGDNLYDNQVAPLHLHCCRVAFLHPITNTPICIESFPNWANSPV